MRSVHSPSAQSPEWTGRWLWIHVDLVSQQKVVHCATPLLALWLACPICMNEHRSKLMQPIEFRSGLPKAKFAKTKMKSTSYIVRLRVRATNRKYWIWTYAHRAQWRRQRKERQNMMTQNLLCTYVASAIFRCANATCFYERTHTPLLAYKHVRKPCCRHWRMDRCFYQSPHFSPSQPVLQSTCTLTATYEWILV